MLVVMQPWGEIARRLWRREPCDPGARALKRRLQSGDRAAFQRVVEQHSAQVLTIASRVLRDPREAEEAAREIFVQAHSKIRRWDVRIPLRAWIYRLAVNESYRRLHPGAGSDRVARLNRLLARTPEEERLVLIWKEVEGYPVEQIARLTGRSAREVEKSLSRGRKRIAHGECGARSAEEPVGFHAEDPGTRVCCG